MKSCCSDGYNRISVCKGCEADKATSLKGLEQAKKLSWML